MSSATVVHYFDYKSPYAYLAQEETFALAEQAGAELELVPYTLDIPSFAGHAELDEDGRVLVDERNPHQWRRIRYAYMDCRREARARGMVLRGPRRIRACSFCRIATRYQNQRVRVLPWGIWSPETRPRQEGTSSSNCLE